MSQVRIYPRRNKRRKSGEKMSQVRIYLRRNKRQKSGVVRQRKNPATVSMAVDVAEDVSAIISGGRMFRLHAPIKIKTSKVGKMYYHEYAPLGIMAYGPTENQSLNAFADFFGVDYEMYAEEKDSKLTPAAKELKRKYLRLVESIDTPD